MNLKQPAKNKVNPNDPYNVALQNIKNYLVDAASDKIGGICHSLIRHKIQ